MTENAARIGGAASEFRAEIAWAGIICLTILAFMPVTPRADALSLAASPSRIMELTLLALAMAAALMRSRPTRLIAVSAWNPGLFAILVAFAAWAALTAAIAARSPTGVVKAAELAVLILVAFASKADPHLRPASIPRVIALAVLAATAILLAANVVIYREVLPMLPTEGESRIRLMLGFNHPLASALLLAVGMAAVLFARFRPPYLVAIESFLLLLFLLCDARGLLVGVILAAIVALGCRARPPQRAALTIVLLIAAFAGVFLIAASETLVARIMSAEASDGSLNGRTRLWSLVLSVAREHTLFGVGYFNGRYYLLDAFHWAGSAHNSFLEVLVGTGIPGAALFLGFALIWLARLATMRDPFLVTLAPIIAIESNLNSILFVPTSAFLLFLLPLVSPLPGPVTLPRGERHGSAWPRAPRPDTIPSAARAKALSFAACRR